MNSEDNLVEPENEVITEETVSKSQEKCSPHLYYITVEPIFFTLFFCFSLTDAASTNIILYRTCTMEFGFSEKNCTGQLLPDIENIVQPYTAKIIMGKSLTEAIIPAILSVFIGSWTDLNKTRKPFLILPLIGISINIIIWLFFITLPVPPIYFLLAVIPSSLFGGFVSIFTCGYAYLSDVTNEKNRAFRMSLCSISLTAGILSGYLLSTEIYKKFKYNTYLILYSISMCSMIIILVYSIFLLPEPKLKDDKRVEERSTDINKSFFNLNHIKESVNVLIKQRPSNGRLILFLLIAIIVIDILIFQGESGLKYLALKDSFYWTAQDFNIFAAVLSGVAVIIGIAGVWLLNTILGLSEPFIIVLITTTSFISSLLLSISTSTKDFYYAAIFGCAVVLLSPMVKSEISHLVPNSDIGKIFAFTSTLEAITPLAASPAYTEVYNIVITFNKPLYIFFVSAAIWLFASVLALIIVIIRSMDGYDYRKLEETNSSAERLSPNSIDVDDEVSCSQDEGPILVR